MLSVKNDGKKITVEFSNKLMREKTILNVLNTIEAEEIASQSKLTNKDAIDISDKIKNKWWDNNKKRIMDVVDENNS